MVRARNTQAVDVIFYWDCFSLAKYVDPVTTELALQQFAVPKRAKLHNSDQH